ncbi:hypothetical protein [Enterococcus saccharolyticus]|uniref:Uncharacterized protein n=2 Tax=Enterococcus saccharolyticus TaxID=41997 RepID=S0NGQ1_9ENTE|nr:hypothetical protein [Enterococcus saccharolyticus]EOT30097.1 hypothetical protein OMQ_00792 [Enterococcus saccharolyticus subsp. saccharolyticus ATCC 43076]EOT80642.1 hypothetical protein I572_01172 [Enterococcus saccharolyticus subsp. saccharolyticus ATCC 43076]
MMKLPFNLKEKITEAAEHIHEITKKDVTVNLNKDGVKVTQPRKTKHTIKWRSKNY